MQAVLFSTKLSQLLHEILPKKAGKYPSLEMEVLNFSFILSLVRFRFNKQEMIYLSILLCLPYYLI